MQKNEIIQDWIDAYFSKGLALAPNIHFRLEQSYWHRTDMRYFILGKMATVYSILARRMVF